MIINEDHYRSVLNFACFIFRGHFFSRDFNFANFYKSRNKSLAKISTNKVDTGSIVDYFEPSCIHSIKSMKYDGG